MAAVTAAVAVGVGSAMNAKAKGDAAQKAWKSSKWSNFGVEGAGGSITFGPDGQMQFTDDARGLATRNQFGAGIDAFFGGQAQGQGAVDSAFGMGEQALPGAFGGAMQASQFTPGGAVDAFTNFSAQNAQFGQGAGMNALATANNFGQAQTGINEGVAQSLFGAGQQALNNTDFSQVSQDQIARQRAFARPGEDRAVNSKFQNLFNRGALSQTGGQRQLGELALSQEMADIQRVNSGEQFANQLMQQNRAFGLSAMQGGLGARQQDASFNLGRAQMFGQQGQNLLNFGGQQAQAGLGAQFDFSNMINSRGQQRLANTQGLLGFGQQMNQGNFQQMMQLFGGIGALNQQGQNMQALSGNLSSQRSAANSKAGAQLVAGAGSPFGSFLEGFGGGMAGIEV